MRVARRMGGRGYDNSTTLLFCPEVKNQINAPVPPINRPSNKALFAHIPTPMCMHAMRTARPNAQVFELGEIAATAQYLHTRNAHNPAPTHMTRRLGIF